MLKKLPTYRQVTLLAFSMFGLIAQSAWAEKDMDYINALKREAKATQMKDENLAKDKDYLKALKSEAKLTNMSDQYIASDNEPEPAAVPSSSTDMSKLTERVTEDLQKALRANNQTTGMEAKVQNDLERMVSSSLEEGHKMDDIRSAVSGAMASLKARPKIHTGEATKLKAVSSTLNQIIGSKSDRISGSPKENYTRSLNQPFAGNSTIDRTSMSQASTITVMKGESLYKISMRLYGVGDHYMELYQANRDIINSPDDIHIGQVLRVPERL